MSGLNKITVERNQRAVLEIAAQPGNGELLGHQLKNVP